MGFSLSDKERSTKLRGIRSEYEPDNVDETLDKIREILQILQNKNL